MFLFQHFWVVCPFLLQKLHTGGCVLLAAHRQNSLTFQQLCNGGTIRNVHMLLGNVLVGHRLYSDCCCYSHSCRCPQMELDVVRAFGHFDCWRKLVSVVVLWDNWA